MLLVPVTLLLGTLDALSSGMSEMHEGTMAGDLPLDFMQFLSRRLGTDASSTLSMLGSFLVTFEPSGRRLAAPTYPPRLPTDSHYTSR